MDQTVVTNRSHRTSVVLTLWVVGCVVVAAVAAAWFVGRDDGAEEASAPSTSEAPAATSAPDGVDVDGDGDDEDEVGAAPGETAPPPEPAPATDLAAWLEGDADGDGAIADDLDADGDGVLDDWVPPDAGIEGYKPGDEAEDGEFEDDRRVANGCDPAYPDDCIPSAPPVLSCADVTGNITIGAGDPHGFDTDYDGIGCETAGEGDEVIPPELDPPPRPE